MLDLIELTNLEVIFLVILGLSMGTVLGIMIMIPTVTRLETVIRNIHRVK